jgi:aspartate carbamoyltransferase catalytic subunit
LSFPKKLFWQFCPLETKSKFNQTLYSISDFKASPVSIVNDILKLKKEGIPRTWLRHTTGKTAVLLFEEPSTRTRVSFELAALRLGIRCLHISEEESSLKKGETLDETLRFLEGLIPDAVILRIRSMSPPIPPLKTQTVWINAGSGHGSHPTQALLDYVTLQERFGRVEHLRIGFCGDFVRSRVFRSHLQIAALLKNVVCSVCSPEPVQTLKDSPHSFSSYGSKAELIKNCDVLYVLRNQRERPQPEGQKGLGIDKNIAFYRVSQSEVPTSLPLMHAGPIDFETDMDRSLLGHPGSLIDLQVQNGLYTRIYILANLLMSLDTQP